MPTIVSGTSPTKLVRRKSCTAWSFTRWRSCVSGRRRCRCSIGLGSLGRWVREATPHTAHAGSLPVRPKGACLEHRGRALARSPSAAPARAQFCPAAATRTRRPKYRLAHPPMPKATRFCVQAMGECRADSGPSSLKTDDDSMGTGSSSEDSEDACNVYCNVLHEHIVNRKPTSVSSSAASAACAAAASAAASAFRLLLANPFHE